MKLRCWTEVTDTAPRVMLQRSAKKDGEVGPVPKRQRTTGSEIGVGARSTEESITNRAVWGNMVKALERIGARISELAGPMERLGEEMKEVAKSAKTSEQTQQQLLEEVRQLVWVQDQTRGMVHVVAKRLERLDGVVAVSESEVEVKGVKRQDKGKEKEMVKKDKEAEESGKSEESEKSEGLGDSEVEDVVKGLEISTLDVDELMEVEK